MLERNRYFERYLVAACCLILLFGLSACSGQDSASVSAPETGAPAAIDTLELGPDVDVKTVAAVKDRANVLVLDVREQSEYDEGHIPGVMLMPMDSVANRLDEIPTDKEIIVTCRSGNRSSRVTEFLRQKGFTNVHNMTGGIIAWENAGYAVDR